MKTRASLRFGFLMAAGISLAPSLSARAYDKDALAFYDFRAPAGMVGQDVGSDHVFTNLIPNAGYDGKKKSTRAGGLVFSSDQPGKYFFEKAAHGATPVMTDPGSVYVKIFGNYGNPAYDAMQFPGLGTAISSNENFTIEFFFKMALPANDTERSYQSSYNYLGVCRVNCGLVYNPNISDVDAGTAQPLGMYVAKQTVYSYIKDAGKHAAAVQHPDAAGNRFWDGRWHHYAFIYDATAKDYTVYIDYAELRGSRKSSQGSNFGTEHQVLTDSEPFVFGTGGLLGNLTGLRISKRIVPIGEFLQASDRADYIGDEAVHLSFEGVTGESEKGTSVAMNRAPLENPFSGMQYGVTMPSGLVSAVSWDASVGGPTYTDNTPNGARKYLLKSGDTLLGTNLTAASFVPQEATGPTDWCKAQGFRLSGRDYFPLRAGSFSIECFVLWDYNLMMSKIKATTDEYRRETILSIAQNGEPKNSSDLITNWKLSITLSGESTILFADGLRAGVVLDWSRTDPTWHHIVYTYNDETLQCKLYVDGKCKMTSEMTVPFRFTGLRSDNLLAVGYLGNNHPHFGLIDEVRVMRRVLDPSEFLSFDKPKSGLILLLR